MSILQAAIDATKEELKKSEELSKNPNLSDEARYEMLACRVKLEEKIENAEAHLAKMKARQS